MSDSSDTPADPTRGRAIDRREDPVTPGKRPLEPQDVEGDQAPEDLEGEVGAEGGSGGSHQAAAPWAPHPDDDSPLGDTDQHSNA